MNQGRIWCVVNPTLGLPLLLGSVALTSLAVHTSVMTHTTWMSDYWMGSARNRVTPGANQPRPAASLNTGPAFSVVVAPVPATDAKSPASFVITVTPNMMTTASADPVPVAALGDSPGSGLIRAASAD